MNIKTYLHWLIIFSLFALQISAVQAMAGICCCTASNEDPKIEVVVKSSSFCCAVEEEIANNASAWNFENVITIQNSEDMHFCFCCQEVPTTKIIDTQAAIQSQEQQLQIFAHKEKVSNPYPIKKNVLSFHITFSKITPVSFLKTVVLRN